jgi:3-hydroxyacyl-CoA dehydrogenase/enoyl-CoA hydratase/3-hydroxybutyryl-CoA epimerase
MTLVRYERAPDGLVTLTLDDPQRDVPTLDAQFRRSLAEAVDRLEAERDGPQGLLGVVVTSAGTTFLAGADLHELRALRSSDAVAFAAEVRVLTGLLRRLETLGRPVAAAITGTALGGGLEFALACHHRVLLDDASVRVGQVEVSVGLIPGGNGTVRLVRLLGLAGALPLLLEGTRLRPAAALQAGVVDALAADRQTTLDAAAAWVRSGPEPTQPWDRAGYRMPGGSVASPAVQQLLAAAPAMLAARTHRAMPAPERALAVAAEGAYVSVEAAMEIETRAFAQVATSQTARNMIETLFFGLREVHSGRARPAATTPWRPRRAAVLGGGMMGSGIAHALVTSDVPVVLLEVDAEAAERARSRVAALLAKAVEQGRLSPAARDDTLTRLHVTTRMDDLADADLLVEAVFERRDLKESLLAQASQAVAADALLASNTSTLPISGLARAVTRPDAFVGLHFFSPVHKMPLVEIIRGEQSTDDAVARAFDVVRLLGKTPIVVRDGRGFFTSRVFGTYTEEGITLLAEGVPAAAVERLARMAGEPVGPLAVSDEVSLRLMLDIRRQTEADLAAEGRAVPNGPAWGLVRDLVDAGRGGRADGGGFYDYPEQGRKHLWPGLGTLLELPADPHLPQEDVRDRLLFAQALEAIRAVEDGIVTSTTQANVGSVLGIGFPPATGGVLQLVNGYAEGVGPTAFAERADQLRARYGDRFAPPALLREKAATGGLF